VHRPQKQHFCKALAFAGHDSWGFYVVRDACDKAHMKRPDMYDYFGFSLIAIVVAMWIAHFVLPPLPPEPPVPGLPGTIGKGPV